MTEVYDSLWDLILSRRKNIPRIRTQSNKESEERGLVKIGGKFVSRLQQRTHARYPKSRLQCSLQLPTELRCCNHVAPRLLETLIKERIGLLPAPLCAEGRRWDCSGSAREKHAQGPVYTTGIQRPVIGTVWTVAKPLSTLAAAAPRIHAKENCEKLHRGCNLAPSVIQSDEERVDSWQS